MSLEEQFSTAAEAYRRANPERTIPADAPPSTASGGAGLSRATDTWNAGGNISGPTISPDLQGPRVPIVEQPPITEAPRVDFGNSADDIFRDPHGVRR
jgi:hypothetical protein